MATGDKHSRTEKPTPKRRREARRDGRVARSPDVSGWAAVLLGSLLLPWYFGTVERRVLGLTAAAVGVTSHPSLPAAIGVLDSGLLDTLYAFVPLGAALMALGVVGNLAQVGLGFSFAAARPKLSRISPAKGFKRLVSPNVLWELAKQVLKLVLLALVAYQSMRALAHAVLGGSAAGITPVVGYAASSVLGLVRIVAGIGLALGIADYAVNRHRLMSGMKMTKQEVKDEHRQQEGDPATKGELRKRSYAIARSRTMAAVKTADVVVANPTHVAVALQYRAGAGGAPKVVAKAIDHLALRVREEAALHRIPVVEDPPLARYLYAVCEPGEQIPEELYLLVAQLLAFVYSLPAGLRGAAVLHPSPSVLPRRSPVMEAMRSGSRARAQALLKEDLPA